jgi:Flp pilus assembly protein TadD
MSHPSRSRRSMVLALLATTAAASLLGACNQTDGRLFAKSSFSSDDTQMSESEAVRATTQWAAAYAKNPQDPRMALGYAKALKAIGSRDRSLDILETAYQTNPNDGELAAELGRLALDMGHLEIAKPTLQVAEAQGVRDWKTLSAQGTLRAKQGQHAEAQQYYLAALQVEPDAVSVINNLALSYALDGKADKSEELLRKAVASGHEDKRVRQNLALVLGLQGKFDEARKVASVDMTDTEAKSSMSYLRNMLATPTRFASAKQAASANVASSADDWQPFAANEAKAKAKAPVVTAAASLAPKVQVVRPVDEIEPPKAGNGAKAPATPAAAPAIAQAAAPAAKPEKMAGTPTLITPIKATSAQVQAATQAQAAKSGTTDKAKTIQAAAPAGAAGLLRTDTD